ncbi:MAG: hypothetical protein BWX73_02119 [Lentisphaerae bacterium ADurb.Bin082]|nr:MAG: hypothetical protein BWX73_02119 [Lentisphaerae bacterium ADurb.Bin082]
MNIDFYKVVFITTEHAEYTEILFNVQSFAVSACATESTQTDVALRPED